MCACVHGCACVYMHVNQHHHKKRTQDALIALGKSLPFLSVSFLIWKNQRSWIRGLLLRERERRREEERET